MMQCHVTQLHKECVPQQLHNLIEVMQLHGIFSQDGGEKHGLWEETWTAIHRFCPTLSLPVADGDGDESVKVEKEALEEESKVELKEEAAQA